MDNQQGLKTAVLPVEVRNIGKVASVLTNDILEDIDVQLDPQSQDATNLRLAAEKLKHSDIPVAFPTETVYGLGADATRSAAVNGIYKAKQRPADNPLIVHFASLKQLRSLLRPHPTPQSNGDVSKDDSTDPIPEIYHSVISKFWPGPLTILLPNPPHSPLAPEVTAGLSTFGARMPKHVLALALIKLANVPVAAPSANASTKPSPTAAEHVAYDLDGRIEVIIDGGPCDVGVESTVVDGLSDPPLILRPGGISIEQLRSCPGWEDTQIGYKNVSEAGSQPKAPGMKYRHYSPKAKVVLYESGKSAPQLEEMCDYVGGSMKLGVISTKRWEVDVTESTIREKSTGTTLLNGHANHSEKLGFAGMLETLKSMRHIKAVMKHHQVQVNGADLDLWEIALGSDAADIARGVFSALRELDREGVDAILVEGIDDLEGHTAAAVMNRLRKAAEVKVSN